MLNTSSSSNKKENCKIICLAIGSVLLLTISLILIFQLLIKNDSSGSSNHDDGPIIYPAEDSDVVPYIPQPVTGNQYYVHLIPHSHQDASWLENVDAYFKQVSKIFDQVTKALKEDGKRKFSVADMMFFKKWYSDQTSHTQEKWKEFVKNKQVEFVNGGWVSTDEATPTYDQLIENMHIGHQFLWEEFNYVPQFAWEIDTFGHSSMNAQLFAQMGFKAMFYQRQSQQDKDQRKDSGELEFIWEPSFEPTSNSEPVHKESIFVHIFHGGYYPPEMIRYRFPFSKKHISKDSMGMIADDFVTHLNERKLGYKTHHLLIPMGDDFAFTDATEQYEFMDLLIAEFKKKSKSKLISNVFNKFEVLYSSLHKYYNSVMLEAKESEISFSVVQDDFEPLRSGKNKVWNGYYTSRPLLKTLIKSFSNVAQSSTTLYSYAMISQLQSGQVDMKRQSELQEMSQSVMETLSLMMHHDTITGTSRAKVIDWDRVQIKNMLEENEELLATILQQMFEAKNQQGKQEALSLKNLQACYLDLKNEINYFDTCSFQSLSHPTLLLVYNPSLQEVQPPSLELFTDKADISEWNFKQQVFEKLKVEAFEFERGQEGLKFEVFVNSTIAGNSLALYFVSKCQDEHSVSIQPELSVEWGHIENKQISLTVSELNGKYGQGSALFLYKDSESGLEQELVFDFRAYHSVASGTYTFKTHDNDSAPFEHTIKSIRIYHGALVKQIQILYSPEKDSTASLVKVNLYTLGPLTNQLEFDVFAGKLDNIGEGKELTVNWKALGLQTNGLFYTDANSLGMLKRTVKEADTVSIQFYPVDSFIMVEDFGGNLQMVVQNSLSEAGSAYQEGRVEFIVNRRTKRDDGLGMQEALKELYNFQTKYFLQFSQSREKAFKQVYQRQSFIDHHPITFSTSNFKNSAKIVEVREKENSFIEEEEIKSICVYPRPDMENAFVVRVTLSKEGVHLIAEDLAQKVLSNALEKMSIHQEGLFDLSGKIKVKQLALDEVREMNEEVDDNFLERQDCIVQAYQIEFESTNPSDSKFLALEQ